MTPTELDALAARIAPTVFRTELSRSGYALLNWGAEYPLRDFRADLVGLSEALAREYRTHHGETLLFHSVSRFDQQTQTRPHRDGGPDASVLVLGYEPSEVVSNLFVMDYSRAAFDRGMTPEAFLDCCNPAFGGSPEALRDYTTELTAFQPLRYQVVIVNNSQIPHEQRQRGMLGLLHHAVIESPRPDRSRWINSLLMGVLDTGSSEEQIRNFVEEGKAATR